METISQQNKKIIELNKTINNKDKEIENLLEKVDWQREIYIEKNYIKKDRIREKINYLKANCSQINGNYFMKQDIINILEELLEETNENCN